MKNKGIVKTALLPLEDIFPNPLQPRKFFDEKSMDALTASIERHGLICPLTVRRSAKERYEIIAGERRYRACAAAGMDYVPAVIIECGEEEAALTALIHNIYHEELLFTEVADAYKNIADRYKLRREELAGIFGKSLTEITRYLKITELPPFVHKLIREYGLSDAHAFALLKLKSAPRQTEAAQKICLNNLTPLQAEYMVNEMNDIHRRCSKRRAKTKTGDAKFFKNTVSRALDIMRKDGFDADMEENEYDWGAEYKIKIVKKTEKVPEGV